MAAQDVPVEVWGKIFELCCNDGGQTGRSLALVSTYFHAVSKPYQYLSVAVTGKHAIAKFAYLVAENVECRRVKHLFMSTFRPDPDMLEYIQKGSLQTPAPHSFSEYNTTVDPSERHKILGDMYRILEFTAHSVRVLHVVMGFYREEIFFPMEFPVLEELTIQGPFHDHYDCNDEFYDTLYPHTPSLRRLYLTDVFTCINDRTYLALEHYAPYLTHLRIQCADGYIESSRSFLRQLLPHREKAMYSECGGDESGESERSHFPETLQRILLHPGPAQPKGRCGSIYAMRYAALRELKKSASDDARIVLFQESPWAWPYSRARDYVDGKKQWLDRIAGGSGCWEI